MKLGEILKYYNTIKYLRPVQVLSRVKRSLPTFRKRSHTLDLPLRTPVNKVQPYLNKPASYLGNGEFSFLNRRVTVSTKADWNASAIPKLWLYNLHYHDCLSSNTTSSVIKEDLITRWMNDNPIEQGNGWEPYPLSLRIVNWIKWFLNGGEPSEAALASLARQVVSLSEQIEYHLLGNHLFANTKAVFFAGCFFRGKEADKWLALAQRLLVQEIPEQFLADGGHFELSTTYHATLTEDLLDIINMVLSYNLDIPSEWNKAASKALTWMDVMTRPDGLAPLFNDAAYGVSPDFEQLKAYGNKLGLQPASRETSEAIMDLPESGYFRFDGANYSFWGDAGQIGPDYIPGHAHCDMLGFELYAKGKPVVVDTGTSTYELCARRHHERSTAAHNTVQVGAHEQSEIWSAFRVARRARIVSRKHDQKSMVATCRYFGRKSLTHTRRFVFNHHRITLEDIIEGRDADSVSIARFHMHPDVTPVLDGDSVIADDLEFNFSNATKIVVADYYYSPEFNKLRLAQAIEVEFENTLITDIRL